MNYSDFYNKFGAKRYFKSHFKNEHGEEYIVIRTKTLPEVYFITGHETDWEVMPLFSNEFNIWSAEEIVKLGQALANLGSKKRSRK